MEQVFHPDGWRLWTQLQTSTGCSQTSAAAATWEPHTAGAETWHSSFTVALISLTGITSHAPVSLHPWHYTSLTGPDWLITYNPNKGPPQLLSWLHLSIRLSLDQSFLTIVNSHFPISSGRLRRVFHLDRNCWTENQLPPRQTVTSGLHPDLLKPGFVMILCGTTCTRLCYN